MWDGIFDKRQKSCAVPPDRIRGTTPKWIRRGGCIYCLDYSELQRSLRVHRVHMPRAPMAVVLVGNESYERDRGESEPYARSTCEA